MQRRHVITGALAALVLSAAPAQSQGVFGKIKQRASSEVESQGGRRDREGGEGRHLCDHRQGVHQEGARFRRAGEGHRQERKARLERRLGRGNQRRGGAGGDRSPTMIRRASRAAPRRLRRRRASAPGAGAWLNYDFVPGSRTIFYDDFSGDEVGDFPRRMKLERRQPRGREHQGAEDAALGGRRRDLHRACRRSCRRALHRGGRVSQPGGQQSHGSAHRWQQQSLRLLPAVGVRRRGVEVGLEGNGKASRRAS